MRKALLIAAAVLAVAFGGATTPPPVSKPKASPPRPVVVIAVDGLSWERLRSWRAAFTSGLKRLLDEGAVATECRYEHLNTETGPGHASLATGAPPRVHGIALNQWYLPSADGTGMRRIYCATQPLPGEPEASSKTIPGPGRLRVPTLGDRMVARDPRAKVVAIANKDRASVYLAGRDARNAAYWYSEETGTYATSAAYDAASPTGEAVAAVVSRFNAGEAGANLARRVGTTWSRLPDPDPALSLPFEAGLASHQITSIGAAFPHDLAALKRPFSSSLLWTPFADRLLSDLAQRLLADDALALGRDAVPDLLAISYSATDYVAHDYGPESVEMLEVLRALDRELGRLLDDLVARFGKEGVIVALSADHGFLPLRDVRRVSDVDVVRRLNDAVDAELKRPRGSPPLIYRYEACSLWLDRVALAASGSVGAKPVLAIVRRELATTFKQDVLETFVIDGGFPLRRTDEIERDAWNARWPGRSGDLFVVLRRGVLPDPHSGKGTSHGSPWEYDTHVPMILWGGGVASSELRVPATPYDLAPTLASMLGVSLPDATGKPLDLK